jgi:hypothetical protein
MHFQQLVGDGGGEVCFAAAVVAKKDQPAAWAAGILGGADKGALRAWNRAVEVFKGFIDKGSRLLSRNSLSPCSRWRSSSLQWQVIIRPKSGWPTRTSWM